MSPGSRGMSRGASPGRGQPHSHGPQPLGDERAEAAASLSPQFREMREVLREFEAQPLGARDRAPAKDRAFYLALRNLLHEIVRTPQPESQRERQDNAYKWFCRNAPVRLRGTGNGDAQSAAKKHTGTSKDGLFSVYDPSKNPLSDDSKGAWRGKDLSRQQGQEGAGPAGSRAGPGGGSGRPGDGGGGDAGEGSLRSSAAGLPPSRLFPAPAGGPPGGPGGSGKPPRAGGSVPGIPGLRAPQAVQIDWGDSDEDEPHGDDRLSELRHRWRMAQADNTYWMAQIRDTMTTWSLHRTRVEEEIARRQEASRYATSLPRFFPDPVGGVLWAEDEEEGSADVDGDFGKGAGGGDTTKTLSPYSTLKPGSRPWSGRRPASASAVEVRRRNNEVDAVVSRVAERNGGTVAAGFAERLRNLISVPNDKPLSECLTRLPWPGSGLEGNPKPTKAPKSPKGKKGKGAKGKKK